MSDALPSAAVIARDRVLDPEFIVEEDDTPPRLESAAGMLSIPERRMLYKIAAAHYSGRGQIVDAGSFIGSSTVSLAEGVKANKLIRSIRRRYGGDHKPIVSYDIGFLPGKPEGAARSVMTFGRYTYTKGESFVPILRDNIAGHEDIVDLRIGDFLKEQWPRSRPIEICFIDLAKTNDLNVHCFRQLFPAFMPGQTLLVQQDFFFDRLPWIKVLMGYLADHFEWLGQVGPSSLYRYRSPIPPEKYAIDPYTELAVDERIRCHRTAERDGLSERRRFSLALSLCYLLESTHGPEAALAELAAVRERCADLVARQPQLIRRFDRAEAQFTRRLPRPAKEQASPGDVAVAPARRPWWRRWLPV